MKSMLVSIIVFSFLLACQSRYAEAGSTSPKTDKIVGNKVKYILPFDVVRIGILRDGGTIKVLLKDSSGKTLTFFKDKRMGHSTGRYATAKDLLWLNEYPGDPGSVLITDKELERLLNSILQSEMKKKK